MSAPPRLAASCACLLGLLVLAPPASSAEACRGADLTHAEGLAAAEARRAGDLVNADGLLWRAEKPGVAPSYLFGTIHSTDESALETARRAAREIDHARIVATELGGPFDSVEKANVSAAMLKRALDRDHDTFEGVVPPEERERIDRFLAGKGYPAGFVHHLQLWFLAVLTALPACEAQREASELPEVDQFLAETARDAGVKVVALETAQEQLDALAAMRPDVAASLLEVTARDPGMNDDLYATMLRLYRESRPAEILPITDAVGRLSESERAAQDEFMRELLEGRNAIMTERIEPLIATGGAFIAVGALHLAGANGLVERLRKEGYAMTKVW